MYGRAAGQYIKPVGSQRLLCLSPLQVELFPALRGGEVDWRTALKSAGGGQAADNYSAFLGDYTPVEQRSSEALPNGAAPSDSVATPPQTSAAPVQCATHRPAALQALGARP